MKIEVAKETLLRMRATARGISDPAARLQLLGMQIDGLLSDPSAGNDAGSDRAETGDARSPLGWYDNRQVDYVIERAIAALMVLGWVKEERLKANSPRYVKEVATAVACAVASMPAVQRAMGAAFNSDLDRVQAYGNVVRAIANMFGLDGDALTVELQPKQVSGTPVIDPTHRPEDPTSN
jgi:hypothetical protein